MKTRRVVLGLLTPLILLTGCDGITQVDNREAPTSTVTGRVTYQGQPVGVRTNGPQLELWEPAYFEKYGQLVKIPVQIDQDGTFKQLVFNGTYKLNVLRNSGPWINTNDTTIVEVNGSATVDIPVTPYYTIQNPTYTRGAPTTAAPGGTLTATFRVGQINTSQPLEFVGLYVNTTSFVDRINQLTAIPVAQKERTRAAILPQLNSNGTISITVTLPANIYSTNSPAPRTFIFARIGVKTLNVTELLFSPVAEVAL